MHQYVKIYDWTTPKMYIFDDFLTLLVLHRFPLLE